MEQVGRWLSAVLKEWVTLLTGGGITAAVGLWERYSHQPVPTFVYTVAIALFLLLANFRAFQKLEGQLIQERQKAGTPPRIRVSRYYADTRYWGAGGRYDTPLSCLHTRFMNDPAFPVEQAIGRGVIAHLEYQDAAGGRLFDFHGR
jgi:hypothetical protein